jgi:hypothetical protein
MKAILKFILLLLLNFSSRSVGASAVVLDSFSDVNFDVSNVFTVPTVNFTPGGVAERRNTYWRGNANSSFMIQSADNGTLNLRLELRSDPRPIDPSIFSLVYSNNDSVLNLLGLSLAVIRVTSFTGTGDILLYLNGGPEPVPITLSGPGDYLLPIPVFTGEAAEIPVTRLTIDFLGRSADFAVTLDEITLIPEPSCSGLLLAGGLLVARMRGRQRTPGF